MPLGLERKRMSRAILLLWSYRILRWGMAIFFVWSGVAKLLDPDTFAVIIREYGLLPFSLVRPVAYGLPLLEVAAGLALLVDLHCSLGAIIAMMFLFIGVLLYGIGQGLDVDCGCFGLYDPETSLYGKLKPALFRDIFLLLVIAFLYRARRLRVVVRTGWRFAPSKGQGCGDTRSG